MNGWLVWAGVASLLGLVWLAGSFAIGWAIGTALDRLNK